jgi:hypothetical protein
VIKVERVSDGDPLGFEVIVREGNGETRHQVTLARGTCKRLTMGTNIERGGIDGKTQTQEIIGSWTNIRKAGNQLIGRIVWANFDHWPKGKYIRDLVRHGHLRTVSVGFKPLERQPLSKEASEDFGPFRFTPRTTPEP